MLDNALIGQIYFFPYNFVPQNWMLCDGKLVPIRGNEAVFAVIGTTYGGDGRTTFALPNMIGRAAAHADKASSLGEIDGSNDAVLMTESLPAHAHRLERKVAVDGLVSKLSRASSKAGIARVTYAPQGASTLAGLNTFARGTPFTAAFHWQAVSTAGQFMPHENRQPYLTLVPAMCIQGLFPERSDERWE